MSVAALSATTLLQIKTISVAAKRDVGQPAFVTDTDPREALFPMLPSYDVVIPSFNRAHAVTDAIESAQAQSHPAERIIIIDDGSSDNSVDAIKGVAARDERVRFAALPINLGVSNARNEGMAMGSAPWVAFLDSDDVWLPHAAQTLLRYGISERADVVVGHFCRREIDGSVGAPECAWDGREIRSALLSGGIIGPSWSIVRREVATHIGGFDVSYRNCEDWDFYLRAAAAGAKFVRIAETVALYRTVEGERLMHDLERLARDGARVLANAFAYPLDDAKIPEQRAY